MRSKKRPGWRAILAAGLIVAGAALATLGARGLARERQATVGPTAASSPPATPQPTPTEPIVPPPPTATEPSLTPLPSLSADPSPTVAVPDLMGSLTTTQVATEVSPPSPSSTPRPSPPPTATPRPGLYPLQQRVGVCGASAHPQRAAAALGFGWYLDWRAGTNQVAPAGVDYLPMIRLKYGETTPHGEALQAAVDALPGAVWLIGNEPDVKWQDNVTAEAYVEAYHDLYAVLKARDPTCQVAIGGVSQPTPLRLRYLDRILALYQARYGEPMPVDVWNVHNFVLREERDGWGVDIPPGMAEGAGRLYEIADHDDLAIFRRQIVDFRRWMAERGQQDKPLILTEYGILMPAEYGFPGERVERFLRQSFEYLRTAVDPALGYPADGHRLVQRWCWFSAWSDQYPTGNLVDGDTGDLTPLGRAFRAYVRSFR